MLTSGCDGHHYEGKALGVKTIFAREVTRGSETSLFRNKTERQIW